MKSLLPLCLLISPLSTAGLDEDTRMREYHKRGYKWPLEKMVPETPGWRRIMERRFEQIERIHDDGEQYDAWLAMMTASLLASNYTENGWGLTRAPEHITKRLQDRLHATLVEAEVCDPNKPEGECDVKQIPAQGKARVEHFINVIEGEKHARPMMVMDMNENMEILEEMKPMFEWWSGQSLIGSTAYGIRAYRNDSNLLMHVDQPSTHIISGIFHVDHSEDSEPWPIVIEDFQGNVNQVYLEAGDILFYESSKCFHGRPQTFIGSYYASIFMHYRPVDFDGSNVKDESHYAVPAHWRVTKPPKEGLDELVQVGTSFKEPSCKNLLCALDETSPQHQYTVNWHGPAIKGKIITTGWDPKTMTPPESWKDGDDGGKIDGHVANEVIEGRAQRVVEDEL